ncbi:hypothetical protein ScPMuIL_012320 [Solemya velum]
MQDFIDLAGSPCLDCKEDDVGGEDYIGDSITPGPMSEEVLNTVCDVPVLMFNFLTRCDWLTPRVPPEVSAEDCVGPVLISQSVAAKLEGLSFGMLSQQVDPELFGGNLVLSQYLQQSITPATQGDVVRCRPVLDHLVKKIQELQMEWPDHPTLVQLIEVVDRILSFPVTSPLMKFLTGVELLLHKAQDWESNAAKFVSISVQLGGISELVIEWRKLELRCWKKSLDVEKRHYQQKARRWWFYLYQLISSYISTPAGLQTSQSLREDLVRDWQIPLYHKRLQEFPRARCQLYEYDDVQERENRKKQEREEKESLYRYTISIHGDERTEEEIEESEFCVSFPTFEKDFIDLAGSPCLDCKEDDVGGEDYIGGSITPGPMSEEALNTVCDVPVLMFNFLTKCDWLTPRVPPEVSAEDCVGPVLISQSVLAKLEGLSFGKLSQQVDPELLGGNLVLSQYLQQSITPATQGDDLESNAAKFESTSVQLGGISELVIEWRKLELR